VRVSTRYLAKVAAWSLLPRAQVTTARGGVARRRWPIWAARAALAPSWAATTCEAWPASRNMRVDSAVSRADPVEGEAGGAGRVKTLASKTDVPFT
jgi:hypothetical protein